MSAIREHDETAHRNVICCLLALEIVDYDTKPVFEQIRSTQDFRQLLTDATAHAASHDVVLMLREDGALLSFLADPEECFTTALTIREATLTQGRYRNLTLRMGINLGKAQIAEDEFGNPYLSGEGRQDADRLMRQGPPRQISVARQFVEILSRTAPELVELLEYQGLYSDTVGPRLCLYRISAPQGSGAENLSDEPATIPLSLSLVDAQTQSALAQTAAPAQSVVKNRDWVRRSWLGYALLPLLAGAALVILSNSLRVEAPVFRPAAQLAAPAPQTTLPETAASIPAAVTLQDMTPTVVATPIVLTMNPERPGPAALLADATSQTTVPEAAVSLPVPVTPQDMTPTMVTRPTALAVDSKRTRPVSRSRAKPSQEAAWGAAVRPVEERRPPTPHPAAAPEARLEPARSAGAEGLEPTRGASVHGARAATLLLAVKPWGEVYVDGTKIGVTPPLKRVELAPGLRLVTITNSSLPRYQARLTVEPGAQMTVAHDFDCISNRGKTCREGFGGRLELRSSLRLETADAGHSR